MVYGLKWVSMRHECECRDPTGFQRHTQHLSWQQQHLHNAIMDLLYWFPDDEPDSRKKQKSKKQKTNLN